MTKIIRKNRIVAGLIYLLFKLSRAIMKARNGIDVDILAHIKRKTRERQLPGFLYAGRGYKYLSSHLQI